MGRPHESPLLGSATNAATIYAILRVLRNRLPEAVCLQQLTRAIQLADWPNVAVRFKMLINAEGWSNPRAWTILDARGRSPNVRSSSQPIVRPRSRGSLPRLPYAAWVGVLGANAASTCQQAREAWLQRLVADVDTQHRAVVCALAGLDAKRLRVVSPHCTCGDSYAAGALYLAWRRNPCSSKG